MKKLKWDESLSAARNARAALPGLARSYFANGRRLVKKPPSAAALHRFRLDTKALRYTLELFRPCYGPGLDLRLAVLRKIQAFLGDINDYATTTELVALRLPGDDTERARIQGILGARARRKTLEFRRYAQRLFNDLAEQLPVHLVRTHIEGRSTHGAAEVKRRCQVRVGMADED